MNFNTLPFLLVFLPACVAAFYLVPCRFRLHVLLAFSLVFYGASGLLPLALLVTAIAWSGLLAIWVERGARSLALVLAVAWPLIALFVSKYLGFTLNTAGVEYAGTRFGDIMIQLALPAGISFYTFQIVAYLVDLKDGKVERDRSPVRFATFIAFFPQLIAGPILRYDQIRPQLDRLLETRALAPDIARGLKYLAFGLCYKIFFADVLFTLHEGFANGPEAHFLDALYSVLSYSAIIYFDFWSYSLMAMGLAKLFAIELPRNFLEPYRATSPKDFWRRWHVTLSYWLRDYVYLRLRGNERYVRNIIIVFLLCGLWHGAGWNFLVWGAYHAALVTGYHALRRWWDPCPRVLCIAVTFALVSIGWPLFYLDLNGYLTLYDTILTLQTGDGRTFGLFQWGYLALVLGWIFLMREDRLLFNAERRFHDHPVVAGLLTCAAISFFSFGRTFIYFQF